MYPLISRSVAAIAAALCLSSTAKAVVLDWDAVTWTPGYSNAFDIDAANAGNDVTVSVAGATANLMYGTPARTTNFQGGLATAQNTLALGVDFTDQTQLITVTVDFSALYLQGVQNVSFTIFDVDFDNVNGSGGSRYQDQLRSISAFDMNGLAIAPIITTSANNSLSGTGLSQVVNGNTSAPDTGAGSNAGNVTISFGTASIRSFRFTYGSGSGTVSDPTYQHIALHDINFTPVPEINPAWTALASCFAAGVLVLRHRANFRK